jgi:glucose dehydrogenase
VSYYHAPEGYSGECPSRIIMGTTDAHLIALDANTGARCQNFGVNGAVDLMKGIGAAKPNIYLVTTPPLIARDLAVVGTRVADNFEVGEPSGVIRAYDAITGKFTWAWDMGRPGINTEPAEGEQYTRGTPNVWTLMSYDDALGLIYAPTGNSTPDFFGAHRSDASEKYSSSVVALDVTDGSVRWSYQTVHHDVWDYDVPSQPTLVDLPQPDGSTVPALVQPTKRGELFLLDRRTGATGPAGPRAVRVALEDATVLDRHAELSARGQRSGHVGTHAVRSDVVPPRVSQDALRRALHATVGGRHVRVPRQRRRLQLGRRCGRRRQSADGRDAADHGQPPRAHPA